jgi:hypothetical protein
MQKKPHICISFEKVETQQQWDELKAFAASFNHKIDDTTLTPLIAVRRGKKLFAYFVVLNMPVLMPSFHPILTTKRDFVEMVEQVRSWAWLSTIGHERFPKGVAWAAFSNPNISRRLLERMGFRSTNHELFQSYPELAEAEE